MYMRRQARSCSRLGSVQSMHWCVSLCSGSVHVPDPDSVEEILNDPLHHLGPLPVRTANEMLKVSRGGGVCVRVSVGGGSCTRLGGFA